MPKKRYYLEFHDSETNAHKFYEMVEQKDGSVVCSWGRVGAAGQSMTYDGETGLKKLNEKLRKGYVEA
jgi:predicted DNA-binding WGR domain protein